MSEPIRMRVIMDDEGTWCVTTPDAKRTYKGWFESEDDAWAWVAKRNGMTIDEYFEAIRASKPQ